VLEPSFITPYEDIILMPTLGKEKYMKEVSVTFNCLRQKSENDWSLVKIALVIENDKEASNISTISFSFMKICTDVPGTFD